LADVRDLCMDGVECIDIALKRAEATHG
jgi:hypothetical protein